MPQRQHYPKVQQRSRILSAPNAILQAILDTQSAPYSIYSAGNQAIYNPPRQSSDSAQTAPHQTYP